MPTAGKLVAAILFGALAWYVSTLGLPLFDEGTDPPNWAIVNAIAGIVMGWIVAGSRAGTGVTSAIGYGLTTVVAVAFWGLFAHSFWSMLDKSMSNRYKGPVEAVVDIVQLAMKMATTVGTLEVVGTALVGGIIAALVTDWFGQRYS